MSGGGGERPQRPWKHGGWRVQAGGDMLGGKCWGEERGGEHGGWEKLVLHELYDGQCSCLSCQGPCLEFVLQHKILDTLHTTGKSDVSPPRPFHQTAMLHQLEL